MEPTKQHPWGRCEACGRPGSARDDLTIYEWAGARECFQCASESIAYAMKREDTFASLEDCRFVLREWIAGRNLNNVNEYDCAPRILAFLAMASR